MKFRGWAMALIAVSLGLKLHGNYAVPPDDIAAALRQTAAQMQRQGWLVQTQLNGYGKWQARRGACEITARVLDPHGTNNTFLAEKLAPAGHIRYAWTGAWYDEMPRFAPLMSYYINREFARQGIATSRQAVWIVGIGRGCAGAIDAGFSRLRVPFGAVGQ